MPLVALVLLLLLPLAMIALMPLILFQRYRAGTARRLARPWVATINLVAMLFSASVFLVAAGVTSFWVPNAFAAAGAGMTLGLALGLIGLWLSRWESTPRSLHYTPNRWLVLAITLVVTARVLYGFWRGWITFRSGAGDDSVLTAFGVAGSLGAGATVLGYYLAYAVGLRRRISTWQKRPLRVMNR